MPAKKPAMLRGVYIGQVKQIEELTPLKPYL